MTDPDFDQALRLHNEGRLEESRAICQRILNAQAGHADALRLLALICQQTGQHDVAIGLLERLVSRSPSATAHYNLGNAFAMQGRMDAAVAQYERALSLAPDHVEAYNNLGNALAAQGRLEQAIASYQRALSFKPDHAGALTNLGNALMDSGKITQAIVHYQRAAALQPDSADAHHSLGSALAAQGDTEPAIVAYQRALALRPDHADAHFGMGLALASLGKITAAVGCYQRALSFRPDHVEALHNLGLAAIAMGKVAQAIDCYKRALTIRPDFAQVHSRLLFALNYISAGNPRDVYAAHLAYAKRQEAPVASLVSAHSNDASPGRRLRIGYVSPDFRQHSVAHFIEPVLAHHDRERFEVFCYYNHFQEDETTARLRSLAHHWRNIFQLSDEQAAQQIRRDRIDILIDLAGHTAFNRLPVFARRPAPVQATWLGYPNTTGLSAMDYRVTDGYADPVGMTEHLHSERLARLPECFSCYKPPMDAPEVSELPARSNGYITFGSFNALQKITPEVMAAWAAILRAVPGSRLTIKNYQMKSDDVRQVARDAFAALGIDQERLTLLGHGKSQRDHLEHYHGVDIGLDPFPYNGATTTCDTLWMGIPVITLAGTTHAGRVGVSQMSNLGLTELICNTTEEYIALAVRLASDLDRLSAWRRELRARMAASPLLDAPRFTRNLEQVWDAMWKAWCARSSGQQRPDDSQPPAQEYGASIPVRKQQALALLQGNRLDEAREIYAGLCALDSADAEAWFFLGAINGQLQNTAEAVECFRRVVALSPDHALAHYNLGMALRAQGRLEDAVQALREAARLAPQRAEVHLGLANTYVDLERPEGAEACYRELLKIKPDDADIHYNLGMMLHRQGRLEEAISQYQESLRLNPGSARVNANLGGAWFDQGKLEESLHWHWRALEITPDDDDIYSHNLMTLLYMPDVPPARIFAEHRKWGEKRAQTIPRDYPHDRSVGRRLRVGYVSPNFGNHAAARFFEPLLANHNSAVVETICYSNTPKMDAITARMRSYAAHWREIGKMADDEVARLIREDEPDILVDLAGHTADNSLKVFARKSAPIQISYIGYPGATGLAAVDYQLTDTVVDPPGSEAYYTEKLWYLPGGFCCYQPSPDIPGATPLPARARGIVTFASFGALAKINERVLDVWSGVLHANPSARLIIYRDVVTGEARDRYHQLFEDRGIGHDRVDVMGAAMLAEYQQLPREARHIGLFSQIDLILDTFPWNNHAMACEALWAGIPLVTLASDRHAGRMCASVLTTIGLPHLVAQTPDEYVAIATGLATDLDTLENLRATLRRRMQNSPLCDGKSFAAKVENAYRGMWKAWCDAH